MPHVVPILTGSANDKPKLEKAVELLKGFGITGEIHVMSAHREPGKVDEFARSAKQRGYQVIVTAAGLSNALSGAVASKTRLPIIGIPLSGGMLNGLDALLSTVQMPPGMPVATFPVDGAANAALDVVRRLALVDPAIDRRLRGFVERGCNVKMPMPDNAGKVRDTFRFTNEAGDPRRLIYTSNRVSTFDVVLEESIPGKGAVLNRLTQFWLGRKDIASIIPNHMVAGGLAELPDWATTLPAEQLMVVYDLDMVPLECIVRGYLVGSAWKEYQKSGTMHGTKLPEGMREGDALPEPSFTPSTKAPDGEHDVNISFEDSCDLVGRDLATTLRSVSLDLFRAAQAYAAKQGIIILDTKFEFGKHPVTGDLMLADEVFTPDSSRFVDAATFVVGEPPQSMDKEYLRKWLRDAGWNPDSGELAPPLPEEVIYETARRYKDIAARLIA